MTPAPKRRWFRFSLRTLFVVVTVLACWLGYAIPWIKSRHDFLVQPVFGEFNDTPPTTLNRWGNRWPVFAPGGMWLLGERGLVSVWLPPKFWSPKRQAEAARLFPEAVIFKTDSKGMWVSPQEPGYSDTSCEVRSGSATNPISNRPTNPPEPSDPDDSSTH